MALFNFLLCGATRFMEESELYEEPKEVRCESESIVSGSICDDEKGGGEEG